MHTSVAKVMGPLEWFLLIVLSVLWGGSFFFGEVVLTELQPFTLVLGRVSIAAIALNVMVRATGHRMPISPAMWAAFLVMGLLNNLIPFSLIFWGQTQISGSLAAILNATTPVWTVLLAHFLTVDERLTPNRLAGVFFGLIGVAVMIGPDALQGLGINVLAQLAVVGAAISYAFAGIFGKRFRGTPPIVTAAGQITGTTVMMVPIALLVDKPWLLPWPGLNVWGALLGLALLSTALAYIIYFRLLSTAGATNLLLVTFLIPVSAILLGTIILNEQLDVRHFAGMGLIGLGLMAIDGRPVRAIKTRVAGRQAARPSMTDEITG
ncbi:MAG: DMT family transporter [Chloroflexi bacterium]|nr:MAG: DMT family transporter [Chloroflexota bacterium]